jgi:hypothetical protein
MISRYSGTCSICNKPTKAGQDIYDVESKESYHEDCRENQQPGPELYALAQRLHFMSHDASLHFEWSSLRFLRADGPVLPLLDADRKSTTRLNL